MEDVFDDPEIVQPTPPSILVNFYDQAIEFLAGYGWFFLSFGLIILLNWTRIQKFLEKRYKEQSEKEYEAKCKKDPDWLQQRQNEMEAARRRMQEESDRKAAEHVAKMKEKEEQRRAAMLASNTAGGQKLGYGGETTTSDNKLQASSSTKKPYRPEYHPLMGSGSSGGYRPPRRGCPGGGCG